MNKMIINHSEVEKVDMGKGVVRQDFAMGKNMNVLHWNMSDGSEVGMHTHPQEQFGYVIKASIMLNHLNIGLQSTTIITSPRKNCTYFRYFASGKIFRTAVIKIKNTATSRSHP